MKKFTKAEGVEVLTPQEHEKAEEELRRIGKTSAAALSESERRTFETALRSAE